MENWNITNSTQVNNPQRHENFYANLLIGFFTIYGASGVLHFFNFLMFVKHYKNGTFAIISQIIAIDILSSYPAITEIITLYHDRWIFSSEVCQFYKGLETLLSTFAFYLLICLNFHVISVWNLYKKTLSKKRILNCTASDQYCSVTKKENSDKDDVDFRKLGNKMCTLYPSLIILILSLSISLPNLTFSSTLILKDTNIKVCTIPNTYLAKLVQQLLLVFKSVVPIFLIIISTILLILKLVQTKNKLHKLSNDFLDEVRKMLILILVLNLIFFVTTFQREILQMMDTLTHKYCTNKMDSFKLPPIFNNFLKGKQVLFSSLLHNSGMFLRSVAFLVFLYQVKMLPYFANIKK